LLRTEGQDAVARTDAEVTASSSLELRVEGITVNFGGLSALANVSFSASTGEVLGVIGPNGAGKTTLFNVICGFVRPSAGRITWKGQELKGQRPYQLAGLGIARTLQGVGLVAGLSVLENVMVGEQPLAQAGIFSALLGSPRSSRDERRLRDGAVQALERLGVASYAQEYPATLPYPVQKRIALARALVAKPSLVLMDEPASGLSASDIAELGELLRALRGEMGVLIVEHNMDLVMATCDRIVVLDFGRVIATGSPAEIRANPAVAEAYLGSAVESEAPRA
jgi:branched-chain amino acid transport system ATP-binding protein